MAQYADIADLPIPAAAIAGISADVKNAALQGASDHADSYLISRFDLPLASWGKDLRRAVANIALYDIMSTRGYSPESGDNASIRDRAKDAEAWLKDVSAGKATPTGVVDSSAGGNTTDAAGEQRQMAFVVQPHNASESADDFWGGSTPQEGGVGAVRRRGW